MKSLISVLAFAMIPAISLAGISEDYYKNFEGILKTSIHYAKQFDTIEKTNSQKCALGVVSLVQAAASAKVGLGGLKTYDNVTHYIVKNQKSTMKNSMFKNIITNLRYTPAYIKFAAASGIGLTSLTTALFATMQEGFLSKRF